MIISKRLFTTLGIPFINEERPEICHICTKELHGNVGFSYAGFELFERIKGRVRWAHKFSHLQESDSETCTSNESMVFQ